MSALFGRFAGRNTCIRTGIFFGSTTRDEKDANMQVNSKQKPEMRPVNENKCIFASFQSKRADIGE
ncbi:hypothetical protein [Cohnella sp. GCM10012308]|uniref:hypothetical protein n=1 Tax=Cohnella sp. GCM10012308 TaxID=3317329 RepID=UPI003607AC7A